jgi:hypothetical protein
VTVASGDGCFPWLSEVVEQIEALEYTGIGGIINEHVMLIVDIRLPEHELCVFAL